MTDPRATATIRALATLAELSANQLEEGTPHEQVIETLRKAAEAVRAVIDADLESACVAQAEDNAIESDLAVAADTDEAFVPVVIDVSQDNTSAESEQQVSTAS